MRWHESELEPVNCDVCGLAPTKIVAERPDGLRVAECECGLAWVSPRPHPDLIVRLYNEDYYSGSDKIGYSNYLSDATRSANERMAKQRLSLIITQFQVKGRRLLEVGSASGEFAAAAASSGAIVTGSDLSPTAVYEAKARYPNVDFICGDIEALSGMSADIICGFEVIEHVLSPREFFEKSRRLLKTGGHLVLTTPNWEAGHNVGLQQWLGLNMSFEHLYFLSPDALNNLGKLSGFELVNWWTSGDAVWIPKKRMPFWKSMARAFLEKTGLLNIFRNLWSKFLMNANYRERGIGHNLFMIFRAK